eukprot:TRINITY_DN19222_c0_g1_i2.p1 TRINITY_DN19222_c0_g1~~TRINITY_DN19222_c0_g1_i2.p1  ORF type:complete len:248 (+),score=30.18 TRINITY_DN19222_c0_g1_i2:84-827(+)
MQVYLWLVAAVSVLTLGMTVYLGCLCRTVHDGKVSELAKMSDVGHAISVGIVYVVPMMVGMTQVIGWVGYWDKWGDGPMLALLAVPVCILTMLYCLLKGSSVADPGIGHMAHSLEARDLVFQPGDTVKYITVGGTKKPHETSHHCDLVAGPPVSGLRVLETLPNGYLRLLYPRQIYAEAIAGGGSAIVGPFESISHVSYLAREDEDEEDEPPVFTPRPEGVKGVDIFTRYAVLQPPPIPDPPTPSDA